MSRSAAVPASGACAVDPSADRGYAVARLAAIIFGWISYAPMWSAHFFADDVDFFGSMCVSLRDGVFWDWLWGPANGHLSVPVRLAYYAVWRWFGRDVSYWHVLTVFWEVT